MLKDGRIAALDTTRNLLGSFSGLELRLHLDRDALPAGLPGRVLEADGAPKIIARLPFVERADHPAALPVFAVSHPAADAIVKDVEVWSVKVSGWGPATARAIPPLAEMIAVPDHAFDGAALLISVPSSRTRADITGALVSAGASVRSATLVGSHATRYTVVREGEPPVPAGR